MDLSSCVGMFTMQKAMGQDAQSVATLLEDLEASIPTPPPSGRLDMRI